MSQQVQPFHVTPEDLEALDPKTLEALTPLLDSLNVTLGQMTQALALTSAPGFVEVKLAVGPTVADSFPLKFRNPLDRKPMWVGMNIRPKDPDHVLTTPFVMQGFNITDAGLISVPWITGVLASNSYALTFVVI